jgi:hypothetical protein
MNIGLNAVDYHDQKVRKKQLKAIDNCYDAGLIVGYVGYTILEIADLPSVLEEIVNRDWTPHTFRVRVGSDIGRNGTEEKLFVSDLYKGVEKWCLDNGVEFYKDIPADDNIHHVQCRIAGKPLRLIKWGDLTDIDLEELRTGPWCNFVSDGITNFLHQVIRRDIVVNQGLQLPDTPPDRYLSHNVRDRSPLDYKNLWQR